MKPVIAAFLVMFVCWECVPDFIKRGLTDEKPRKLNGLVTHNHPSGNLRFEIQYKDGLKHGKEKEYFENGKLFSETDYVNGIRHGFLKKYHKDGLIYLESPYDSGRLHGVQKKWHKNGNRAAEIPYRYGQPCAGIKEYVLDGSPKTDHPHIVVTAEDNLLRDGEYILYLSVSNNTASVSFFLAPLPSTGCMDSTLEEHRIEVDDEGRARLIYSLPQRTFLMKELSIVANVKTRQGNPLILTHHYNLAIERRR